MSEITVNAEIVTEQVNAKTLPSGPRGNGISKITANNNILTITFDNGSTETVDILNWWFGTRDEYNALDTVERTDKDLYFIEEGS